MIVAPFVVWIGVAGPDLLQAWCGGIAPRVGGASDALISEIVKASSPQGLPAFVLDAGNDGLLARSSKRAVRRVGGRSKCVKIAVIAS